MRTGRQRLIVETPHLDERRVVKAELAVGAEDGDAFR
jgi:hypothetical protein